MLRVRHISSAVFYNLVLVTGTLASDLPMRTIILVENRDFLPLLGRGFTSEYCQNVWYGKTRPVRVSDSAKWFRRYVYSFRQNTRIRRTDAAQRHRALMHGTVRQKYNSDLAFKLSSAVLAHKLAM